MGVNKTLISSSCECSDIAFNSSSNIHAAINISSPTISNNDNDNTAPLALVAVIDISFSMQGERLRLAKDTLSFIVDKLRPRDQFAIVTFGSNSSVVFPLSTMTSISCGDARRKINAIRVSGCTHLSAGLFSGINCLENASKNHTCSIMLLTDGQANQGITNINTLVQTMERKIDNLNKKINVFTFGYGRDHKAPFLRSISDSTDGMYYFIENTSKIGAAFAECLGGVSTVALRSVVLKISPINNSVKITNILADLQQDKEGNNYILQLGNLSSGERRNIPLELKIEAISSPNPSLKPIISFNLSYNNQLGNQSSSCTLNISRPKPENCSNIKSDDYKEIDEQRNRVKVAEVLKQVIILGENNKLENARNELTKLIKDLKQSDSSDTIFTKSLITDVQDAMDTLRNSSTFKSVGIKYLYSLSRSHYQQRASGVSSSAAAAYLTDGQKEMLQQLTGNKIDNSIPKSKLSTNNINSSNSTPIKSQKETKKEKLESTSNIPSSSSISSVDQGRLQRGIRRLMTDLAEIKKYPLPCVTAEPLPSDFFEWHCNMQGPPGNPYHNIIFHIIMQFPPTYPFQPPKLFFCSYLKHEHVFKTWICLDMLQEFEWSSKNETDTPYTGWTTAYSIHSILLQLQSFLFDKANTSNNEVLKAKNDAKQFSCKGCSHNGFSNIWPKFSQTKHLNPISSIEIPKASVKSLTHNPKPLPQLLSKDITNSIVKEQNISNNKNNDNKSEILNKQQENNIKENNNDNNDNNDDNEGWNIVPTKGKKKSNNNKKIPTIKSKTSKSNTTIHTSNRFLFSNIDNKSQVKEQQSIPNNNIQIKDQNIKSESLQVKNNNNNNTNNDNNKVSIIEEDYSISTKKANASQKKNLKRRRKLKRMREEKEKQRIIMESKIHAAKLANERVKQEDLKNLQIKQEEAIKSLEKTKKQKRVEQKNIPCSLQEALNQLKGSYRGLSRSLFIFLSDNLIQEIFSYLDVTDLISISKSCRIFYRIGSNENLWKSLCIRYFPSLSKDNFSDINGKIRFGQEVLATKAQIFCFHTRKTFDEDIIGIPVSYKRNPRTKEIQYISTTLDLLSHEGFYEDKVRKSVWKRPFTNWLPLYITSSHATRAWNAITKSIAKLCDANTFKPWMVLNVLPKLMNTMVVSVMSGETHASIVALEGYCAFHHMLLKMIEKYPSLSNQIDKTINNFIKGERYRTKDNTPSLGDFIPLLTVSEQYQWNDVRSAYIQENFDRNALWVIKKYPALRNIDKNYASKTIINKSRLEKTFDANRTSMRLLMFHVYFLNNIARPNGQSLKEVTSNYDLFYGRPTAQMKEDLQQYCKKVLAVQNWPGFFKLIGMKIPTQQTVTYILNQAILNSKRKHYHS